MNISFPKIFLSASLLMALGCSTPPSADLTRVEDINQEIELLYSHMKHEYMKRGESEETANETVEDIRHAYESNHLSKEQIKSALQQMLNQSGYISK